MTPKKFDYYSPTTISEAIQVLHDNEDAKVLAGGQSLLALMKLRLAAPTLLVDISKLQDFSYIREDKEYIGVGALTTHDIVEHSPVIKKHFALLQDAASKIGDQQIRNVGTIGGSACHADPAADLPTALTAANASFVIRGGKGERVVPATEFFVSLFETAVGHDEVLSEDQVALHASQVCDRLHKAQPERGRFCDRGHGGRSYDGRGECVQGYPDRPGCCRPQTLEGDQSRRPSEGQGTR